MNEQIVYDSIGSKVMTEKVGAQLRITDDLIALLNVLPPRVREALKELDRGDDLIEIVLDLGRLPEARFTDKEVPLSDQEVTHEDIDYVVQRIGQFTSDNRAGIERTLHRISAIRNRQGNIVGLTCRVGRAVYGTIDIIQDIIESGKNILLLGRPGVGKTTLLREAARVLAEKKRVIVVDTSNEIAGDGDIPHPGIGRARRMQVATPTLQHEVMIEAVENHMPEVIVIDEIGRELEAEAARTIAERGVQLVGTAHGGSLDNLLMNPTLCDLVGGIESVTLSDEEARRRGTQKTVLERKAPPTFDVLVEIQYRWKLVVYHNVAQAVDDFLRGRTPQGEIRYRDENGVIHIEPAAPPRLAIPTAVGLSFSTHDQAVAEQMGTSEPQAALLLAREPMRIFPYGISQARLRQAAAGLQLPIRLVDDIHQADVVITLKAHYRKRVQPVSDAESLGVPIYVLRSNTITQMQSSLIDIFNLGDKEADAFAIAMRETQEAIRKVLEGARAVDLSPQNSRIRRFQHEMARQFNLVSHSYGREPQRRVRIYQG
ncbi:MAG: AAA family ATPase [Ardenticatenia bacterium]|jgi:stage III sporulation protein SpoIIIAA|nr:MAG: AAA family ATPase [Ardenticatenia bacterium]